MNQKYEYDVREIDASGLAHELNRAAVSEWRPTLMTQNGCMFTVVFERRSSSFSAAVERDMLREWDASKAQSDLNAPP